MGGGGGGSYPKYEATYRWYRNQPRPYENQKTILDSSNNVRGSAKVVVDNRIIKNEADYRSYLQLNEALKHLTIEVEQKTDIYLKRYPDFVINRIVGIETIFERINQFVSEKETITRSQTFTDLKAKVKNCVSIADRVRAYIERVDYYRRKMEIKREIEGIIRERRDQYLRVLEQKLLQQINVPDFKDNYISSNGKIYIGLPPT